ncbi:MAG: hypothetical protein CVT88_03625 [Candidatus Altiarchaeales archaeon HGW-Altiarchaeales-1]|nr:MAG: hypothetical protein CVT89_02030 [Candidatus Altiarchaeales archaeon HGW-Altiarchaeales-2]PKP60205.1 MAG: hypothetical protein CVT88_03625 [Candidatus Altiarchaeales archaeon HGW-Altiarchaeales-1]
MTSLINVNEIVESNRGMANALTSRIERIEREFLHTTEIANENRHMRNRNREIITENTKMRDENEKAREYNKEMLMKSLKMLEEIKSKI